LHPAAGLQPNTMLFDHAVPLHGPCCVPKQLVDEMVHMAGEIEDLKIDLRIRGKWIKRHIATIPDLVPRPPYDKSGLAMARF
jgi:hypothetical protein